MKKIIKKILTIACCLTLCLVCLTGCSWLEIDKYRYYNEVVATVGDKEFYKKDLIEAFSNYGYQYNQQYGYSIEESMKLTINNMVDNWLLLEEIKKNPKFEISEPEELEIKRQVFDYMQNSIFSYEAQVREEWDMVVETEEESEIETLRDTEEEYAPTTYYAPDQADEDGNVVFRVEEETTPVNVGDLKITDHFNKSMQIRTDQKVSDEAWARYIKALQDRAKAEGRSQAESEVLRYEEDRLFELYKQDKYMDKYEKDFFANLPVDVETVLEYYKNQYKSYKELYSVDKSQYHTAMQSASSEYVYFHPNSGNEYINVKHILINFTEAQKAQITDLNTEYGITDDGSEADEKKKLNEVYKARLQTIVNQTKTTFELNGETYTWNALVGENNVLDYVYNHVNGATLKERATQFNELIYVFNDDPGIMNSEFDYVVNIDTSVKDQMVKPFADGVRALEKGIEIDGVEVKGEGSMNYIVSSYGIHIIFHAGTAKNIVEENNIDNISDAELLRLLCTTMTTPESNKSIFNFIYDKLNLDENVYNNKSAEAVKTARTNLKAQGIDIKIYPKNYNDLW
ncbi:MAG: hypothetical protein IJW59_02895 [Clostridia bacterium]|nr:hypothetical protein [Clostridia bacterium]